MRKPITRFHGTPSALAELRSKIKEVVGKDASGVKEEDNDHFIEVDMTPTEREKMRPHLNGAYLTIVRKPK